MKKHLSIFKCPGCAADLEINGTSITCVSRKHVFMIKEGIPLLCKTPTDGQGVTNKIKEFYEQHPLPNYDEIDNTDRLISKAKDSVFGHLLNEQIGYNTKLLEIGCGTGQLSNFLATKERWVFGADLSFGSLRLGNNFKNENEIKRVGFYQMDLFKPIFKDKSFDFVISNGVLHHTEDAYKGFVSILKLLKKDGYIIVGLYNKYGRLPTDIRRFLINTFGKKFKDLDPYMKTKNTGAAKKEIWFLDQYKNPHETKYTIEDVVAWFDKNNVEFVKCIPSANIFNNFSQDEKLFEKTEKINKFSALISQLLFALRGSMEGGLFVMIGKKNE